MQGAVSVNGHGGAGNRNSISTFFNSDHADFSASGTAWHATVN
jgi:hypothetical protein